MGGDTTCLTDFFDSYAGSTNFMSSDADDIFSMLEVLEGGEFTSLKPLESSGFHGKEVEHPLEYHQKELVVEAEEMVSPKRKRQKLMCLVEEGGVISDGQPKVSHITVERNRRKQMNQHLTVLRSLMPCFYVKRGDQASIIGGVVDYITELQQVLESLEAKKQRKVYSDHIVLSPRRLSQVSPRKPPLSPRPLILPISPRTPQPVSPAAYRGDCSRLQQQPPPNSSYSPSSTSSSTNSDIVNELGANSKSPIADVEVKFSGPNNLLLKTISPRLPCQATKIVSVLEDLSLEILQAGIDIVDQTLVNSFTIKIGIECQLSAEDLVQHIQQTFC